MELAGTANDGSASDGRPIKTKILRCVDWLQKQNELVPKKLSLQNQNDIQFIIECNAQRRNFLLSAAEDDTSIPAGVDEPPVEPHKVPLRRLRVESLRMLCEWHDCLCYFTDYDLFQRHVADHLTSFNVKREENVEYSCLWDTCGHKTLDYNELERHLHFHAYHAKLLSIGFNGRATLNLERCKKDSSKRNRLPQLETDHVCMWIDCEARFKSVQAFFDHVKAHIAHSENNLCSWAGCGSQYHRRVLLTMHVRSHTGERLIACYHCGRHFASNRKLREHLDRQNVNPEWGHQCDKCSMRYPSAYLLREHSRQHIGAFACSLCDMSAHSQAALALHVRYRHLRHLAPAAVRNYACALCPYRAITKCDLKKHTFTHTRKKRGKEEVDSSDVGPSDEENSDGELKRKKKVPRKYACHICPGKVFSRGTRLTKHLVKVHEAQWPFGYSRFRYQLSADGMYKLTETRFELLEISQQIERCSGPKCNILNKKLKFDVKEVAEPTETTPRRLEVVWTNSDEVRNEMEVEDMSEQRSKAVEITMCDVDEDGNIISSEIFNSDLLFAK